MKKIIPLTKIGFFNPGRLSDEEIEQMFITRIAFFEHLFKKISAEKPGSIPQHYLVIGQRGMGKTSLLIRIAAELRKEQWKKLFIALSFPEEQYNVDKLSKFWLNCMDALADAIDREGDKEHLAALDKEIQELAKDKTADTNKIYEAFCKWTTIIKRRPVLLVDNLNLIFDKINKDEQHLLRGILMSADAPILVGASATTIDDTVDYGSPFYDAFQINYLKKLSFDESLEVLTNLARITGSESFETNMLQHRGRLQALYALTGGTPRTLAILFPLVQNGFSNDIQTDLDALLDAVTPLYKARFEELAAQLQVVLDAVALHWAPINLEQLRDITQLDNQQISPQIKRLVDVGWLQKLDAYKAKGNAYEMSERFFNIWYLMRRSSRRQKRELYCLSKFLESFYGDELHEIAKVWLQKDCLTLDHATLSLALADVVKDEKIKEKLRANSYNLLYELSKTNANVLNLFEIPKEFIDNKQKGAWEKIEKNFQEKNYRVTLALLDELIKFNPKDIEAFNYRGVILSSQFSNFELALNDFESALKLDPRHSESLHNIGSIYFNIGKTNEAEEALKKSIKYSNGKSITWHSLGKLYQYKIENFKEAEKAYIEAVSVDSKNIEAWKDLAKLYMNNLSQYENAKNAFLKTIEIEPESHPESYCALGYIHDEYIKDYELAENYYKQAIEIDDAYAYAWYRLGNLYGFKLLQPIEAETALKKGIKYDPDNIYPLFTLGILYMSTLTNYKKAEEAFNKILNAEPNNSMVWGMLGLLYQTKIKDYNNAFRCYNESIKHSGEPYFVNNGIGNLYMDVYKDYINAEKSFKKAISLDNEDKTAAYNLLFLWRDKLNKIEEAKKLYTTLEVPHTLKDSHYLNGALFEFYENNLGLAKTILQNAIDSIKNEKLPDDTEDDWYRSAAIIVKLGHGEILLKVLAKNEWNIIMRPFYVAIEALTVKDELFLNSIAAEVREPARIIMEQMKNYMS